MDVSASDQSDIIGKRGAKINWLKKETGCSFNFPECGANGKQNEVKITGDIECAEQARSRVRNLIPLIFSFELIHACIPNVHTLPVKKLQQQYKVKIFSQVERINRKTFVIVKGYEWENEKVKQATCLLIEFIYGNPSFQIPIKMCIEISSDYHEQVNGQNNENLNSIMENTQTQISFLGAEDSNITRNKAVISGNIDTVYLARQQLMGSLPLEVMFDLPKEWHNIVTPEKLVKIQAELGVTINICPLKSNCVIRGMERYASKIYKARNRVLEINEPGIVADIPLSYFIPKVTPAASGHLKESSSSTVSVRRSPEEISSSVSSTHFVKNPIARPATSHQAMSIKHPIVSEPSSTPFNRSTSSPKNSQSKSDVFPLSLKTNDFYEKQEVGIRELQNNKKEGCQVPTCDVLGYDVSYTNIGALNFSNQDKDKASKNLIYSQGKLDEYQKTLTTHEFDQKRVAEIRDMQNKLEKAYQSSTSGVGSGYGDIYTGFGALQLSDQQKTDPASKNLMYYESMHNENQKFFKTPNFDHQQRKARIPGMQNKQERGYQISTNAGWGYRDSHTSLGTQQLSDQGNRNEYQHFLTAPNLVYQKRPPGIRKMQNKQEKGYGVSTSAGTGYGVSYTSLCAPQLSDQSWQQQENQASKNLMHYQSKCNQYQQSFTIPHLDQNRVAWIPEMENKQGKVYRMQNQQQQGYRVSTSIRNECQPSFTTPDFDQKRIAWIPQMQHQQEQGYRVSTNTESDIGVCNTSLGALQLSDQENTWTQKEDDLLKDLFYYPKNRNEYQRSFTTPYFDHGRVSGIRVMQNKQDEKYQVLTSTGSGNGGSYNNLDALQSSDPENIWRQETDGACQNLNYSRSIRNKYQQPFSTPVSVKKRIPGVPTMQNKEEEEYHRLTSSGSGYGVSYNNLDALHSSHQENIWRQEEGGTWQNLKYSRSIRNEYLQSFRTPVSVQERVPGVQKCKIKKRENTID